MSSQYELLRTPLKIEVLVGSRFSERFPKAIANPIINYGYFQPDQVFWRPFANKKSQLDDYCSDFDELFFLKILPNKLDRLRAKLSSCEQAKNVYFAVGLFCPFRSGECRRHTERREGASSYSEIPGFRVVRSFVIALSGKPRLRRTFVNDDILGTKNVLFCTKTYTPVLDSLKCSVPS